MKVFDSHNHIWKCEGEHFDWITEELHAIRRDFTISDLENVLEKNGVEKSVLVQAIPELWETKMLLEKADSSDRIAGVIGWVDVTKGDEISNDLSKLRKQHKKLIGIRYMSQGLPSNHLISPLFIQGVQRVGKEGLIYELLITAKQLKEATILVSKCPDVTFIIEHIAKPSIRNGEIDQWSRDLNELASYSNVHCKLSGMVTEADLANWEFSDITPYMDAVLNAFGENRVIYGSDYPVCLLAASYERVLNLTKNWLNSKPGVSAEKILYSNAASIYL